MQIRLSTTQTNLLSNIGALLSGTLLARVFGMVGVILLARLVGPTDYGHFAASLAVIKLAAVLFSLGLDHWLLRYGGRAQPHGALTRHGTSCLVIKVGLGALWWVALAIVAPWLDQAAFPVTIVLLVGLTVWLEEVANVAWTMYNSASANKTAAMLLTIYQFLQLVAIASLAVVGVRSLHYYLLGQLVAALVGCSVSLYRLHQDFGFALAWADVRTTLRGSIPFATSLALALIYGRADITIVATWLGSAAAGIYAPAVSLVMTLLLIPLSIYSVVLPPLSRAHAEDRTALQRLARDVTLGSALVGIVTGGALALSADLVVRLIFGEQYGAVGRILVILSAVVVLRCISFAVAAVLTAVGWQTQRTLVQTVVAVANVGLDLLIVTRWGVVGVAWIFVLTDALLLIGYVGLLLYWRHGQRTGMKRLRE